MNSLYIWNNRERGRGEEGKRGRGEEQKEGMRVKCERERNRETKEGRLKRKRKKE